VLERGRDRRDTAGADRIVVQIQSAQRRVAGARLVRAVAQRRGDGLGAARSDAIEGEAERAQRAIVLEAQAERQRAVVANLPVCRKAVKDTSLFSKQMSADA
jgi:hypothetical protein